MKKLLALLLTFLLALSLFACGGSDVGIIGGADGPTEIIVSNQTDETTADTTLPEYDESHTGSSYEDTYADDGDAYLIDEEGWYYSAEDVALYLATYDGELPDNFITKNEARDLGWEGGSVEKYAPGFAIGGDKFGNRDSGNSFDDFTKESSAAGRIIAGNSRFVLKLLSFYGIEHRFEGIVMEVMFHILFAAVNIRKRGVFRIHIKRSSDLTKIKIADSAFSGEKMAKGDFVCVLKFRNEF